MKLNTKQSYLQPISDNKREHIIRKIVAEQSRENTNHFIIELRKQKDKLSCYILFVNPYEIKEYHTSKQFFKKIREKQLIRLTGSIENKKENMKYGIFVPKNITKLSEIIQKEIRNKKKPTKKQIGILTKSYKKIIYKNARNSQFYIIPSLYERNRVKQYESIRKNTVKSLIKKGLIEKKVGQIYTITQEAKEIIKEKAVIELKKYKINMSVEEWIHMPKLMQEYVARTN